MSARPQNSIGKIFNLVLAMLSITFIWSDCTNKLESNTQTLRLYYITWACDCANWATEADIDKYPNYVGDSLAEHCIFLEPANALKALPDFYEHNGTLVQVTGQFYTHKGFPQGYSSGEMPDVARVFRYTSYKILRATQDKE